MTKLQTAITISISASLCLGVVLIILFYERMKQSVIGTITGNYFTDTELCRSDTARKYGIDNTPSAEQWTNLHALRDNILNPARETYGSCIYVNVAFRSAELNKKLIELGYTASDNSQHCKGEAADITTKTLKGNRELFSIIAALGNFDQLIWEGNGTWIHVSYSSTGKQRGQILAQNTNKRGYTDITNNWQTAIA